LQVRNPLGDPPAGGLLAKRRGRGVSIEAASGISFVVSQTIGLDAGRASADYIHLYHGNAALLAESLEVIQRTSALILSAIETPAAKAEETQSEADPEPALAQAS
jgi:hypothetical protein